MATISKSVTVVDGGTYTLELNVIPTGSTVTPVNNIQTWLHCADIWDKSYTTIDQVLADAGTLQALIASTNAVDYMVRSTNFASSVCANANAMSYIGANNYCANTLLANGTWCNAICNSTYFKSVLTFKVPTMTGPNTPSGSASASSATSSAAWQAFDGIDGSYPSSNCWIYSAKTATLYYSFPQKCKIYKYIIKAIQAGDRQISTCTISNSNDAANYDTVATITLDQTEKTTPNTDIYINTNPGSYSIYAFTCTRTSSFGCLGEVELYGRA